MQTGSGNSSGRDDTGPPGPVEPQPSIDPAGSNIEGSADDTGIDASKVVNGDSLAESLSRVADTDEIQYRLSQQAILSDFGLEALRLKAWPELIQTATAMCAEGMRVGLCKALCYDARDDMLAVVAGVGWNPGVVGVTRIAADIGSPAGYALRTGKPVISNHLHDEHRFRTPPMLIEHGVLRAINVLIMAHGKPWGILEVDSRDDGRFEVADIAFLQGFANLLGVAFERHDAEEQLRASVAHQRLLVSESSHRAKNSLLMLSSLLTLQARASKSEEVKAALGEATSRIATLASAHDLLWQSSAPGVIDIGRFIADLCVGMQSQAPRVVLRTDVDSIKVGADNAIAAGLLVTELVTNAFKHGFPEGEGEVVVVCKGVPEHYRIEVADRGRGLPEGFDIAAPRTASLGMRMVVSLARQLGGEIEVERTDGTRFVVRVG